MYWDAVTDLEDAMAFITMDVDLLDRAERRDLPTPHQQLIAKARALETLNENGNSTTDCNTDLDFSDMDNFMNWNTSSSFENFEETVQKERILRKMSQRRKVSANSGSSRKVCPVDFKKKSAKVNFSEIGGPFRQCPFQSTSFLNILSQQQKITFSIPLKGISRKS